MIHFGNSNHIKAGYTSMFFLIAYRRQIDTVQRNLKMEGSDMVGQIWGPQLSESDEDAVGDQSLLWCRFTVWLGWYKKSVSRILEPFGFLKQLQSTKSNLRQYHSPFKPSTPFTIFTTRSYLTRHPSSANWNTKSTRWLQWYCHSDYFVESSSMPTPQRVGLNSNSNPPTSGYFESLIQHSYMSELEYFPHCIRLEIGSDRTLSLNAMVTYCQIQILVASKGDFVFDSIPSNEEPGLNCVENLFIEQLCVLVYESVIISGKNIGYLQLQATALMTASLLLISNFAPDELNARLRTLKSSPPSPIPILPIAPSYYSLIPACTLYQYFACCTRSLISYFLFLLRKRD